MLFYLTVVVLLASVQAKFYTDCGSKLATVEMVGVNGCAENAIECILKRNTNATISIDFTPNVGVSEIETEVHGVIMNLPVPFPLPNSDACKDNHISCPLKSGEKVSYITTMQVLKSYPQVKVDVKWELKTKGEDLVCILIPARIRVHYRATNVLVHHRGIFPDKTFSKYTIETIQPGHITDEEFIIYENHNLKNQNGVVHTPF